MISTHILDHLTTPALLISAHERIYKTNALMDDILGYDLMSRPYKAALRQPSLISAIEQTLQANTPCQSSYHHRNHQTDCIYTVYVSKIDKFILVLFEDQTLQANVDQFRRDFVANVSHELRSPLTSLIGFLDTLQGAQAPDPHTTQKFLAIMSKEALNMQSLVDDLLCLSRVEHNERTRPTEHINLTDLIQTSVSLMMPQALKVQCPLNFKAPSQPLFILGDEIQLHHIFSNLITNALKYGATETGIQVVLHSPQHDHQLNTSAVRVDVTDFGAGIPERHLPRLTERFYRIDKHRSKDLGGTGLGLAIVKHSVTRHQGRLNVSSLPRKGSTFSVFFPYDATAGL